MSIDNTKGSPPARPADVNARPRVGLVLGGGGAAGLAFHAGTLLALEHDLGWNPASADVIVGTSAGSIVAALLRSGLTTDDLAAWGTSASPLNGRQGVRAVLDRLDAVDVRVRPPRPTLPRVLPLARRWWQVAARRGAPPHTVLATMVPYGSVDAAAALRELEPLLPAWPERRLCITAVRLDDARRVRFEGPSDAAVVDAVAASCAVPGLFRPVRVGGARYIDGGAHSPTNADVLAGMGVDVAVVLAPMSVRRSAGAGRPPTLRLLAHRWLAREVTTLRGTGIDVVTFEPSAETVRAMGWNLLDSAGAPAIVSSAFLTAGAGRYETTSLASAATPVVGPATSTS